MARRERATLRPPPRRSAHSASLLPPVLDATAWQRVVERVGLSEKQAHVVALMMRGLCDKQIGPQLGISYGTVRTYRERALRCLGLDAANRAEVTSRVFQLAWEIMVNDPCPRCGCRRKR